MQSRRPIYPLAVALALLLSAVPAPSMANAATGVPIGAAAEHEFIGLADPALPVPRITFEGTEPARSYTRFLLAVENWQDYSIELFSHSDQPACASRTWVDIYAADGTYINGFCGLREPEDLTQVWFAFPREELPPLVYLTLTDHATDRTVRSNTISVAVPTGILIDTAIGVTAPHIYSTATKTVPVGSYVTWHAKMSPAWAGERVEVWMATKPLRSWTAFRKVTTRQVDAAGSAYFWYRSPGPQWVAVRFAFAGNTGHMPATSLRRFARYIQPEVLKPGSWMITLVPNLRVRSQPRISDDSIKYEPPLPKGTNFSIVSGPVKGSGYTWYLVELAPSALHGGITRGWVSEGDRDGTPWIKNIPID